MPSSNIDVLIVGAGPAGYMAATWLTKFKGLKVRFIEKRSGKVFAGQADGLQCRTLEVLQSFGFADRVWKDANHMLEICFWNPDANGVLARTGRIPDTTPGLSRFQQVVLHQGWIEGYFRDHLAKHGPLDVEHSIMPESLDIDESKAEDPEAYPVRVVLRHLPEEEATPEQFGHKVQNGLFRSTNLVTAEMEDAALKAADVKREVVNAKYVLGCDGAHSWVRRQLGYTMEGEHTDYVWGVLDIVPLTNFPDIRMRCAIHSESHGSVMVIPRENKLVRLYIQLSDVERNADGLVNRSKITPEQILHAAQKIMAPYTLTYEQIDWFTAYQIGQRVANKFSAHDRVFLAGDACHTHSPKAGQGMNVSMMDQYNLAWKVGSVLTGKLQRHALSTYQSERQQIARDLIAFDKKFAALFSGKPAKDAADAAGISLDEFKEVFRKGNLFASGVAVSYSPSSLIVAPTPAQQALATGLPVGMRFNSFKVLNQSDARPWEFQDLMPSDGRWRLVVFAGDIRTPTLKASIAALGPRVEKLVATYGEKTLHVLTCHAAPREEVELSDFPRGLRREHEYWSVYVDAPSYHEGDAKAYENYGVGKETGALVVVRPDGYVSVVCGLGEVEVVERFLEGCLVALKA
ncbi:FAD binding domain-containing protein [Geopyxis carbonaria]|nr:FAD binding domain-containing protein [Geopyxis carbonaria]